MAETAEGGAWGAVEPFDYARRIAALAPEERIAFYLEVAFGLTIAQRAIWSERTLPAGERVDRMKWVNGAQHRILGRLRDLTLYGGQGSEESTWGSIAQATADHPALAWAVEWEVRRSYRLVLGRRGVSEGGV